ncbi:methyltransferase [Alkalinema pantanalense CENA528]|uniref:methyltransferase n=1 Tax=Alkalinema pantanalense TaxID=1620705 RepID=UPI003D6F9666
MQTVVQPLPSTMPLPHPSDGNAQPPQMLLSQMITGYWVSQCLYAAAKLNLADHLKDDPRSVSELATATHAHAPSLYRLLRALASVGVILEGESQTFTLTPLGFYLRSDAPGSVAGMALMMGDREHYNSWGNIVHSVMTGESAFENLFGMQIFDYYAQNPQPAQIFDRAMSSFSAQEISGVLSHYDFSGIGTLVDVAGGHGSLLTSILQAYPTMQGILFDLPAVIAGAQSVVAQTPVADRCQLIAGSFFEPLPTGANAYILKHIIHDWDDARSIEILKQCRTALADNGKVLVVEQVIPPGNKPFMGKLLDVNMLVMCPGGKERTAEEYEQLFAAAGLRLTRIVPTPSMVSVVEGVPA